MGTWYLVIPPHKRVVEFSDPPHGFVSTLPVVVNGHSLGRYQGAEGECCTLLYNRTPMYDKVIIRLYTSG